jgi:DNA-binding response OmpR family regulator
MNDTRPSTILLVDNDDRLRSILAARLTGHGYHCITACSGAQALSMFRSNDVRMVVTDLNMPAGDGIALATEIRRHSGVPIMFVTGFRDTFRRVMRAIPDVTILQKPFDPETLLELIGSSLSRTRARDSLREEV